MITTGKEYGNYFSKTTKIIEEPWIFIGEENSSKQVEVELIVDCEIEYEDVYGDEIGINFTDIFSDFYYVVGLSNKDKIKKIEKIAGFHRNLLWLKRFYNKELRKCLNGIKKKKSRELTTGLYDFWHQYYFCKKRTVSYMYRYLIENKDSNENELERIFMLCVLYSYIFFRKDYRWYISFFRNYEDNSFLNHEDFWNSIDEKIVKVFDIMNKEIEKCQSHLLALRTGDLVEWEEIYGLEEVICNFEIALEKFKCGKRTVYKDVKCCGIMKIGDIKYFTINGIKDKKIAKESNLEKIINVLRELLGNAIYVGVSDETRYYLGDGKFITYKDYTQVKKENKNNRMFTCCEKKLLSEIFNMEINDTEIKLVITKLPCPLCKRAIDVIKKENEFIVSVECGESELPEESIREMDVVATNILNSPSYKKHE